MKIIVCNEKHGDYYYDASTPEAWAKSALHILTERFNFDTYYRPDPNDQSSFLKELEEKAALSVDDKALAALPESMQSDIKKARSNYSRYLKTNDQEIRFYDAVAKVVKEKDLSLITVGRGRYERKVPLAWELLDYRAGHEYERVELVEVRTSDE